MVLAIMPTLCCHFSSRCRTLQESDGYKLRKPLLQDHARLLAAASLWGSSFLLNAIALEDFPPVAIAGYRITLAAILLIMVCSWMGLRLPSGRGRLGLLLAIGVLNTEVPFSLIGWGQLRVDSSTTAILLASTPFFTLLFSHFMTADDRFTWQKLAGLALGFSGVLVLLGQGLLEGSGSVSGILAIILAGCCYSLSALLIRRLGGMPSLLLVAGSITAGALVLVPAVLVLHPPWQQAWHAHTLGAVLFLALGPTATAYVLRAQAVQLNGAVYFSNVGYLIPPFAMFWGWLFLANSPSMAMWAALTLILAGIGLGQGGRHAPAKAVAAT